MIYQHSGKLLSRKVRDYTHLSESEGESHSVVSDSLRPHGMYSPWNSPGQNTGVGSLSLLRGIFPTQGSNPGLLHCRQILYSLNHQGRVGSKSNMAGVLIKGRETQKQMPRETAMR